MIESSDKLNNQAILLASGGNYYEAIACFKRAITIDRCNYLIWYNMGITYRDAGDLREAKKALETAFSIAPDNSDVAETFGTICLMLKDYSKVIDICEEGLDYNPLDSHLWNLMGVVNFQTENYDKAEEYFQEAVTINPYYLDGLYNLRDTYDQTGNTAGMTECEKMISQLEK